MILRNRKKDMKCLTRTDIKILINYFQLLILDSRTQSNETSALNHDLSVIKWKKSITISRHFLFRVIRYKFRTDSISSSLARSTLASRVRFRPDVAGESPILLLPGPDVEMGFDKELGNESFNLMSPAPVPNILSDVLFPVGKQTLLKALTLEELNPDFSRKIRW